MERFSTARLWMQPSAASKLLQILSCASSKHGIGHTATGHAQPSNIARGAEPQHPVKQRGGVVK